MTAYEQQIIPEIKRWQRSMQRRPSLGNRLSKKLQNKMNSYIPEKVHAAITAVIKQMTRAVFFGAGYITPLPAVSLSLEEQETKVLRRIDFYRKSAATEGALTGAGGILLGLVDFPAWMTLKIKMLFDIAALYGYDVRDYKERVYLLHIFQLTFSSQQHRNKIYKMVADWEQYRHELPDDIHQFDWRSFQQEYRDYIDIAKMLQLVPGIGAVVGAYVNHRLTNKLGRTAMNAYRMRRMHISSLPGTDKRRWLR